MAHNEYNQDQPSPTISTIASLSFALGLVSFIGSYTLATGPAAIIFGIVALRKGVRDYRPIVGIAGGAVFFGIKLIKLILAFV
ncbi:MAG: hypothetical protein ACI3W5_04870 [Faecousia sp.]